jgi:hypothetical protein
LEGFERYGLFSTVDFRVARSTVQNSGNTSSVNCHSQEQLLPVDDHLSAFHHPFHVMDNDVNFTEGIAFHCYQISEGTRAYTPQNIRLSE